MKNQFQILLVEDDPAVATSLKDGLTKEGYAVDWYSHGNEAIRHAKAQAPDLFILDVRLPDITGFDVCQRLRKLQFNQPILILTVQSDEVDKVLGLEMGADDYVTKPYSLREILSRIRALLRRTYGDLSSTEGDILYIADIVIDRTRGQVLQIVRVPDPLQGARPVFPEALIESLARALAARVPGDRKARRAIAEASGPALNSASV